MTIHEVDKSNKREVSQFVRLERELLGKYPLFVSNFDDEVTRHLTGGSPAGRKMQTALFIAMEGDEEVARCAALINPLYQAAKNEAAGFIGYFAASPGREASVAEMFGAAEKWLKRQGVSRVIAPYNGSALLGYGILTAGFDEEPIIFNGWNPPYYPAYFSNNGYRPTYPMLVYRFDFASEAYQAAKAKAATRQDVTLRPINKKDWLAELEIFRTVTNENFTEEWLWYPVTQEEFVDFLEIAKPMFDPRQMVIAEVQGKPAGVMIGFPNWNAMARGFKGKTGNLEKLLFLIRGRKFDSAGLIIGAVKAEFRGKGIGPLLELKVLRFYEEIGLKVAYGYTVDEDNLASRKMNESAGGVGRLMYHAYDKLLQNG